MQHYFEKHEFKHNPKNELKELTEIYENRSLHYELALEAKHFKQKAKSY